MTLFSRCSALRVLIAIGHLHSTEGMLESGCFCLPAICEVVIRNTVPFQTALCERVALKKTAGCHAGAGVTHNVSGHRAVLGSLAAVQRAFMRNSLFAATLNHRHLCQPAGNRSYN